MCIAKTFVYDCKHKHLIRLHCHIRNPLLCSDLKNSRVRRYYDCCCCIEYQLSLGAVGDEKKVQEDGAEEGEGKDIRGWLESVGLDDYGEGEREGEEGVLESVERDGEVDGDVDRDVDMDMEDGEVMEGLFEEAVMRGVVLNGGDEEGKDRDGDGDGKRVESLEEKEKREKTEEKERKRREEVLEGMAGGGF